MAIRIGVSGDIMGHLGFGIQAMEGCPFGDTFSPEVVSLCKSHHELWGNLEGPCDALMDSFAAHSQQLPNALMAPHLFVPQSHLTVLSSLGFRVLSIANNHCFDLNRSNDTNTTALAIAGTGMHAVGLGPEPVVREIEGISFAVFGMTTLLNGPGGTKPLGSVAMVSEARSEPVWRALKAWRRKVDFVVAFIHWGKCYSETPGKTVLQLAYALLEEGVDVIVGAHSHVIWPIMAESLGKIVAFSMGNFAQVFGVPPDVTPYSTCQRSLRTGLLSLEVSRRSIVPIFTPLKLRHSFEPWFQELQFEKSFWKWNEADVKRWRTGIGERRHRLRSRLELDGIPIIGNMGRAAIECRYGHANELAL